MSGILQAKAAALLHDEQGTVHKDWTGKVAALFSLESQRPLTDFDLVLFAVRSENDCLNVLEVLAMAGIPPLAAEQTGAHPLLAMGEVLTSGNPEHLARAYEKAGLA